MTARPAGRGFTLLEVMVALAILAASLLALSDVVAGALRNEVRARNLEVATLLARGKMAEIEDHYEWKGFKATDESEEGTFEEEGHPEFAWKVKLVEPEGTLDGKALGGILLGGGSIQELLQPKADADGRQTVNPMAAGLASMVEVQLNAFAASVKQGVRELRLTVSWKEGAREESFSVVTHLVVLQPAGGPK